MVQGDFMEDYIITASAENHTVRAFFARTTGMVSRAQEIHRLSPTASAALGRTLTAAAMMSRMLKENRGSITIQIKGDGPLGGIVAVTDSKANVRGYVHNPDVHLPLKEDGKLDVGGAVGRNGYLNVIRDLGLKEPYIGYVNLVSGEIAEDIAYYFASSEQTPTVIALGVLIDPDGSVSGAGGYMIQLMPGAGEDIIEFIEGKISRLGPVSKIISDGKGPEEILEMVLRERNPEILDKTPCSFSCNCSRERMERNLVSLGKKEIEDIISEQHEAEVQCHFCNTKYHFSEDDLKKLLDVLN